MALWCQAFVDFENKNVYESAIMCTIYVGVVTYITLTRTVRTNNLQHS